MLLKQGHNLRLVPAFILLLLVIKPDITFGIPSVPTRSKDVIRRGHSHNDYHQQDPLHSALSHGIRSIEVDVFPVKGELLVAHTRFHLDHRKTIESMYLEPILKLIKHASPISKDTFPRLRAKPQSKGDTKVIVASIPTVEDRNSSPPKNICRPPQIFNSMIHPHDESLLLLVDFKANPDLTAKLLDKSLGPLKPHLSKVKNGRFYKGKVTVVISGKRPKKRNLICQKSRSISRGGGTPWSRSKGIGDRQSDARYLFMDGRIRDLRRQEDTLVFPLISLDWKVIQLQRLAGRGERFMTNLSARAHEQGKRIRVWGAPNNECSWNSMMKSNIDWLSIDDHLRFSTFATKGLKD